MKKFTHIIFTLIISLLANTTILAGNYTWTGATNTDWATATNWNPNGIPSTNDTVTIVSQTNLPVLAGNTNVKKFTMTSGTLDCNGYTLTISATATFNGGAINNGTLTCSGTSTLTFAGTTFGAAVNATGNNILFNGSVFNSTVTAIKKGSSSDNGSGGNVFNAAVTLTDSGTGNLVLSNNSSAPDTFNAALTVSAVSSGGIYLAHQGTGNVFNGEVTFSTGNVFSNTYGTASYNGNITLNSASGNISFGNSTGSWTLASGKNITIGTFSAGTLTIRNLTQSDNSINMRLVLTGTAKLLLGGNSISAKLYASSNQLTFSGSRFLSADTLIYTGGNNATSTGGNYFGSTVYIANTYTGTNYHFILGSTSVDTFTTTTTIATTGNTSIDVEHGLFLGAVTFKNAVTSTGSDRFYVQDCIFKGALTLDGVHSGINFRAGSGNTVLDSTATLSLVSGYAGQLTLSNLEQRGGNAISLNISTNTSSGNSILTIGPNATFNANFAYLGQRLELNGGTFNGDASFTRFSQSLDVCTGGNVFNGTTLICDSVAATTSNRVFKLANTTADDYNANVTFKQYGTGTGASTMKMYPAYAANSTFAGNVTVESNTVPIEFGAGGGKVILDGSANDTIRKTGSQNPAIKKLELKKTGGLAILNLPLSIADSIIFTTGYLKTDSVNLLTIGDNCIASGAGDYSAVAGPIKKVGNDAFTFPFGERWTGPPPIFAVADYVYHPLTISAPSNTTDAFTAQYFSANHNKGTNADSTIENESTCEYWKLERNTGSSNVTVKLGWNWNSCNVYGMDSMHVVVWDTAASKWKDKGNGGTTGNLTTGTVVSSSAITTFGYMTLADKFCTTLNKYVTPTDVKCKGGSDGSAITTVSGATPPYNYSWSESKGTNQSAINLTAGNYTILVTDSRGCMAMDTVVISEPDSIEISIASSSKSICGDSAGFAVITHTGGTGTIKYLWSPYGGSDSTADSLTSGIYFVLLTDSLGCIAGTDVYISDTLGPSVVVDSSFNVTCAGLSNGRAYVSVASGVSPFAYLWIPSSDTTNYSLALKAGTNYVEVTDSSGCRTFEPVIITEPDPILLSVFSTKSTCGQATGTATVYASGGSGSYAYYWSPSGGRNAYETNIIAGYDTVMVVDSLGCVSVSSVYIEDTLAPVISMYVIANNVCTDSSLGSARVLVSGGTPPYEYLWLPDSSANDTVTNLTAGLYNVFVTDSNGCKATSSLVIEEPPPLIISMFGTNASSDTINDGVAGVYVTGGTPPYSYIWLPDSETTATITGKGDGSYTVIVTDNNGCSRSGIFYLTGTGCLFSCDSQSDSICMPMQYPAPPNAFSVVDIVDDFFADPTGNSSSECAFEAAVNYFMNNLVGGVPGNGILTIPHGTYIVGYQYHPANNSNYLTGHDVLCFQGCQNITIEGKLVGTSPKIKFYDCIKYGTFDPVTGKRLLHSPGCYNSNDPDCPDSSVPDPACICNSIGRTWVQPEAGYAAWPGNMFLFENSTAITLKNLELDGNTDNASIGGYFAMDLAGINLAYDGILFNSCSGVTIDNLNVHHFGRDGIGINDRVGLGGNGLPPVGIPMNLNITNSRFNWNGRNGMSWDGGNGVNVLKSDFNYNGQARVSTNPRDGLDIEWEGCNSRVEHGFFKNCNFLFNVRCGVESNAQYGHTEAWSNDFIFEDCNLVGAETGICLKPNARSMLFNKCQFFGIVNSFYDSWRCSICNLNPFRNQFINSFFTEEYNNQYSINSNNFDECNSGCGFGHDYMINMLWARCAEFKKCQFTTNYTMQTGYFVADWNNDYWNFARYTSCIFNNTGLNATVTDPNNPVPPCNVCALDWLYMRGAFFNLPLSISFHYANTVVNNLYCGAWANYHSENVANAIGYFPGFQSFADLNPVNCLPKFTQSYANRVTDLYSGPCNPPDCFSLEDESCPAICYPPCNQRTIKREAENPAMQIAVFPSPSQYTITVSNVPKDSNLSIYNALGNCLFKAKADGSALPVDISGLPEGIYIVKVDNEAADRFIKVQ